jgi:hypothetical protein
MMDASVKQVLESYPNAAFEQAQQLRKTIFECANELGIDDVSETLKWGEPSYLCKQGSTLRFAWYEKNPEVISIFVNCNSKLMSWVQTRHPSVFITVGNREIQLPLDAPWPEESLKDVITLALNYHTFKGTL